MPHPLSLLFPSRIVKGASLHASLARWAGSTRDATGKVKCPACTSSSVRRSARRGLWECLTSIIAIYPYRCNDCTCRFAARGRWRK